MSKTFFEKKKRQVVWKAVYVGLKRVYKVEQILYYTVSFNASIFDAEVIRINVTLILS